MKNLLLLLLLANILYFMWGLLADDVDRPGVVVVEESEFGPPLSMVAGRDAEGDASVGAVLGSGEPSDLAAVVGRSCVSIGPFKVNTDAETALAEYAGEGMQTGLRSVQGQIFVGYWVRIRNIPDRVAGRKMLDTLGEGGLTDAYMPPIDEDGLSISLGLFGDIDRAERVELQAKSLGLPADITPTTREGTLFFLDIGLPPGKGASAMVERYGEEKVLRRDAATCPKSN
ncbi:hypothetical protein GWP57_14090 [Gammaproteobacteria bacterium]|jgi:hypothetical protein|nr:hypothetical protein [Gammaproteobacteria bacterium]